MEPIPNPGGCHSRNFQSAVIPVTRLQSVAHAKGCRRNQGFSGLPREDSLPPGFSFVRNTWGTPGHRPRKRGAKLSPRIIPRAGWSMLPGRTSHFREEINCPRRFCETAGMPEGIGQRGRWYDVRSPLSGGSKYTMIPVMWTLYITGIMWSSDLCGVDPISHCCPVSNHSFSAHKNPATFL